MQNITEKELKDLISIEDRWCLSVYMPADPVAASADMNRIRLKNLLRRAESLMEPLIDNKKAGRAMMEAAHRLSADEFFWRYQNHGLAVFISPHHFFYYRLPLRFNEQVRFSGRFFIKPLIPLLMNDTSFYLLALSRENIRLLTFTPYDIDEIDLGDLPARIRSAFDYDTKQSQLQFHTGTPSGDGNKGGRPAVFHGQGVGIEDNKNEILRFFQRLDVELRPLLEEDPLPLVLAGVEYLLPLFRKASDYKPILEDGINGNPDELPAEKLHQSAMDIISREIEKKWRKSEHQYRDLAGKGYTAAGVYQVLPNAAYGRVKDLFVALDENCAGIFDQEKNQLWVTENKQENPVIEDLFNRAVVETIRHGGNVYGLEKDRMPERDTGLAAILRY